MALFTSLARLCFEKAFPPDPEKERREMQAELDRRANLLEYAIRISNNGYLFTPTGEQLAVANLYPARFAVTMGHGHPFPHRIALRGVQGAPNPNLSPLPSQP